MLNIEQEHIVFLLMINFICIALNGFLSKKFYILQTFFLCTRWLGKKSFHLATVKHYIRHVHRKQTGKPKPKVRDFGLEGCVLLYNSRWKYHELHFNTNLTCLRPFSPQAKLCRTPCRSASWANTSSLHYMKLHVKVFKNSINILVELVLMIELKCPCTT